MKTNIYNLFHKSKLCKTLIAKFNFLGAVLDFQQNGDKFGKIDFVY